MSCQSGWRDASMALMPSCLAMAAGCPGPSTSRCRWGGEPRMCREAAMHKLPARRKPRPVQFADARAGSIPPTFVVNAHTRTTQTHSDGREKSQRRKLDRRAADGRSGRKKQTIAVARQSSPRWRLCFARKRTSSSLRSYFAFACPLRNPAALASVAKSFSGRLSSVEPEPIRNLALRDSKLRS
eukprot:COSAG04_NODE_494_length_13425_cov_65.898619_11_plen_184_part_00